MKKISTMLLVLSLCLKATLGQTPVITMTTSKTVGSNFSFYLAANAGNNVTVDFGNGTQVPETVGNTITIVSSTLVGSQTVKIYGTGITVLQCDTASLTALDVSNATSLSYLSCFHNQLNAMDVTKNTALVYFYCSYNQLNALNVSNNILLNELECSNNQLTVLDMSKNTAITGLFCNNNRISNLNLTNNTALTWLWASNNQLTTLDVSRNTVLAKLYCEQNQLNTLNVNNNSAFTIFTCWGNLLTFTSLPLKQSNWTTYTYAPQAPLNIVKAIGTGTNLDLSTQLTINGNTTVYTWKTKSGTTLIAGTDYTLTNGKTVFLKAPTDSVYCEMTNVTFPDFIGSNVLITTYTKVTATSATEEIKTDEPEIYCYNQTLHVNLTYNAQCSVFDVNGRLVVSTPLYSGANTMQLQYSGVYLVKITRNSNIVTRKIVVQ